MQSLVLIRNCVLRCVGRPATRVAQMPATRGQPNSASGLLEAVSGVWPGCPTGTIAVCRGFCSGLPSWSCVAAGRLLGSGPSAICLQRPLWDITLLTSKCGPSVPTEHLECLEEKKSIGSSNQQIFCGAGSWEADIFCLRYKGNLYPSSFTGESMLMLDTSQ